MHIAVVGCGHGEIDKIYEVIENIEQKRGIKVSLLLCCGDFQSVRNMTDLRCMSCPLKYQQMHDFHRYYSGEKKAPVLTLFIGGNHEASNFLQELPYGGWVAPNIYYLGYAGVVKFGKIRIAGLSGIYKGQDYLKGRFEVPPYDQGSMRSVYHYRNLDIFRLKQLQRPVDIILSHDWPKGIHNYGDVEQLLRRKPFFRDEIERNELGSRPLFEVLEKVRPSYWFSAHMHVKFAAFVPNNSETLGTESKEIDVPAISQNVNGTKFLALDKVLPRRQFLQIIEIPGEVPSESGVKLEHDLEWLAILKATNHLVSAKAKPCFMPGPGGQTRYEFTPKDEELNEIRETFQENLEILVDRFSQTGLVHHVGESPLKAFPMINPQTKEFCDKLGIDDPVQLAAPESFTNPLLLEKSGESFDGSYSQLDITLNRTSGMDSLNPDEISLDLDQEDEGNGESLVQTKEDEDPRQSCSGRSKLILPPPKCSGEITVSQGDLQQDDDVSAKELQLLKSVMGDSEEPNDLGFFIDMRGEEPNVKRKRDAI